MHCNRVGQGTREYTLSIYRMGNSSFETEAAATA